MPSVRDQCGFALPLTILVITVMTMLIASANVRARADRIIAESNGSTVGAFAVAQSGLHRYFAYYDSLKVRPVDGDSLRINVPSGYADVVAHKVQSPSDTMQYEVYVVRSTGFLIEPIRGSDPAAQRTVAQFAQWHSAAIRTSGGVIGAFTAANGLDVDLLGGVYVNGFDYDSCLPAAAAVPGILATAASTADPAEFDLLTGSPAMSKTGGGSSVASNTGIDWPSIANGQFVAEYDAFQPGDLSYPTMLISGDLSINDGFGTGLLMVTGDLTLTGSVFNFKGVLLVGGTLRDNTSFSTQVLGVVVTGLNEQLGNSPPVGQLGGVDAKLTYVRYASCEIRKALNAFVGFEPISNAWIDNWAMY